MNAKIVITLILGLVFQLAQVLPGAVVPASCAPHSEACECCAEGRSCHCSADNSQEEQAPKPAVPDTQGAVKAPMVPSGGEETFNHPVPERSAIAAFPASPRRGPPVGFEGVRLSVAFCSIVI